MALVARDTLPWVAASSARIAFEHALTAQWVLTENGEDRLVGEISAAHLTFAPDGMVRGVDARGRAAPPDEFARALAVAGLWAMYVLEVCRKGQRHAADVREMGERAGLPVDLRASDQHPERQPTTAAY